MTNAESRAPAATHVFARARLPGSPKHLALLRIVLGGYLISVFSSGAIPLLMAIPARVYPGTRSAFPLGFEEFAAQHLVRPLLTVGLVASIMLCIGLLTRTATLVTLVAYVITQNYYYRMITAHDDWLYFTFFLLVFLFAPVADAWSVDARIRPRRSRPATDYRWPVEWMGAWLALLYVAAGVAKLFPLRKGIVWLNGYSIQGMVANEVHESGFYWILGHSAFDYQVHWPFVVLSWVAVAAELSAITVLFWRRAVPWVALAIIGMHASIAMFGITGFLNIFLVASITWWEPKWFGDTTPKPAADPIPDAPQAPNPSPAPELAAS
ncbi:MAG: HTTM domain-containing protein [Polyangiales bacterium]|nr:HTTM domain-containing protein [Myxococcales bacterium]